MRIIFTRLPLVLLTLLCLCVAPNVGVMFAAGGGADPALYSNDWRTTGPPGGDVRALVVDPSNPDRFYFGTLDGQIRSEEHTSELQSPCNLVCLLLLEKTQKDDITPMHYR